MNKPVNMITKKDCSYLSDIMGVTLMFSKKCKHYTNETQDAVIKEKLVAIQNELQCHYDEMLRCLGNE